MKSKTFAIVLNLFAGSVFMGGCSLFDKLEKDINFVIEKEISVKDTAGSFSGSELVDALSANNDFKENKSHIKSASIERVSYFLSYYNGTFTQTLVNGKVSVADENGGGSTELATLSNVRLMDATKESDLPTNSSGIERAKNLLLGEPFKARLTWNASLSEKGIDAKIKTRFHVKVTVKP